jgi:hypothetical protein
LLTGLARVRHDDPHFQAEITRPRFSAASKEPTAPLRFQMPNALEHGDVALTCA